MPEQGVETGKFGGWLTDYIESSPKHLGFKVFFDHGNQNRYPNVLAPKAFFGDTVSNSNRLADLDIVVLRPDGVADLIIEIEERPCSPKKILGDVLALMLCNQIAVRVDGEQDYFRLSPETTLIVAGVQPGGGQRLKKIEHVLQPRLHALAAPVDSIDPKQIQLVFAEQIAEVIGRLRTFAEQRFPA
jgi:hypothetical protein